jgi:hypothetical protein
MPVGGTYSSYIMWIEDPPSVTDSTPELFCGEEMRRVSFARGDSQQTLIAACGAVMHTILYDTTRYSG